MYKKIIFLCSLGFYFFNITYFAAEKNLERAYFSLFSKEFGYTLIGAKPVSFEDGAINEYLYRNPDVEKSLILSLKKLFSNSKKIVFKVFPQEDGSHFLEIIHLPALKELVSNCRMLQEFIQTNFKNENDFYQQISDQQLRVMDVLKNDALLKGIVLGYGEANSKYFCRRCELINALRVFPYARLVSHSEGMFIRKPNFPGKIGVPYLLREIQPSSGFSSLAAEWKWMKEVLWDLRNERDPAPPFYIALPFYISRHGGDSEAVREKYRLASIKLARLFYGKSCQQVVAIEALRP